MIQHVKPKDILESYVKSAENFRNKYKDIRGDEILKKLFKNFSSVEQISALNNFQGSIVEDILQYSEHGIDASRIKVLGGSLKDLCLRSNPKAKSDFCEKGYSDEEIVALTEIKNSFFMSSILKKTNKDISIMTIEILATIPDDVASMSLGGDFRQDILTKK